MEPAKSTLGQPVPSLVVFVLVVLEEQGTTTLEEDFVMYRKLLLVVMVVALIIGTGGLVKADTVGFIFDPADFFAFQPPSGFSGDGGMFALWATGGIGQYPSSDPLAYASWKAGEWTLLDSLRTSLDAGEGIGYVQAFLPKNTGAGAWGQDLSGGDPLAFALSTGWTALDPVEQPTFWVLQWQANSSTDYARPGGQSVTLAMSFDANEAVTIGGEYTFWFGGDNQPGYIPGISFGAFAGGFASDNPGPADYWVGSAYETSVNLTSVPAGDVPEPSSIVILAELFGLIAIASRCRWRRKS